jgi:dTDP-4-amino-4,6-dideoxygalactose transaminase
MGIADASKVPFLDLRGMTWEIESDLEVAWKDVIANANFIGGPVLRRFEVEWAKYCGTRNAVGLANGTDAIELTLRGLGVRAGDEVIVPTNTFVATAEAIVHAGATPRFVDVDPTTLLLTADAVDDAVTARTCAVIAVHLYGNLAPMHDIDAVARRRGLVVLEDAAQAHGAREDHRRAGSFGTAGCFSFYPGKNLGAFGDAGAVVTDDDALAGRIRVLADHGRSSHTNHDFVGRNSRLDALQAAVLLAKLQHLDEWNRARRQARALYRAWLVDDRIVWPAARADTEAVVHLNVVLVPERDRVRAELSHRGVQTGVHYPVPCHLQKPYWGFGSASLPVAEHAARHLVSLPMFPHITEAQIQLVCEQFDRVLATVGT